MPSLGSSTFRSTSGFSSHGGCISTVTRTLYLCTFTMLNEDHAVLYGRQTENGHNKDVYNLNIPKWVCNSGLALHPTIFCRSIDNSCVEAVEDLELKRLAMYGPARYNAQSQLHSREYYKENLGTFRRWKTWTKSLKCPCFPVLFTSISICNS